MKQELFYKLKQNSLDEFMYIAENRPKALQILLLVIKRTNRETGKAFIGYTDFDMTQREYRTAKKYLEDTNNCKFIGTKKGTIAEISDKIFDLNIDKDTDREMTEIKDKDNDREEKPKTSSSIVDYDIEEEKKTEYMAEIKNENRQCDRQLTKNYIKNKEYSNNINIITSETDQVKLNDLIPLFEDYNMNYEDIFKNKTERKALQDVVDKIQAKGGEAEVIIKWALEHQDKFTRITKPTELKRNINKIILNNKQPQNKIKIIKIN